MTRSRKNQHDSGGGRVFEHSCARRWASGRRRRRACSYTQAARRTCPVLWLSGDEARHRQLPPPGSGCKCAWSNLGSSQAQRATPALRHQCTRYGARNGGHPTPSGDFTGGAPCGSQHPETSPIVRARRIGLRSDPGRCNSGAHGQRVTHLVSPPRRGLRAQNHDTPGPRRGDGARHGGSSSL